MIRLISLLLMVFIPTASIAQETVLLTITSVPSYHLPGEPIYAAGTFNGWNSKDEKYKFRHGSNGIYSLELKINAGKIEYKLTRGGWDKVECSQDGAPVGNRELNTNIAGKTNLIVSGWADHFPSKPRQSTASGNVKIIDTAFFMPQLNRNRRIWIYLPAGYTDSKQKYPVLYMHD